MKKFIIAMVAVVLGFSSCSKEAMLLGSWELESIKMLGVTINVSEADMNITLTFKEGNIVETSAGVTSDYSIKGDKIIIENEGENLEFEFEVSGSKLVMTGNFEIADSAGGTVTLTFKKR